MPNIVPKDKRRKDGYQCDGCLDLFPIEEVTKECACGAYLCKPCKDSGYVVACYCGC